MQMGYHTQHSQTGHLHNTLGSPLYYQVSYNTFTKADQNGLKEAHSLSS